MILCSECVNLHWFRFFLGDNKKQLIKIINTINKNKVVVIKLNDV